MANLPQYRQVALDKNDDYLFDPQHTHFQIAHYILNGTKVALFVKDLTGRIFRVPSRPNCHPGGNVIFVNTTYRTLVNNSKESRDVIRYRVTPAMVGKGRAVYIRELGLYLSTDQSFLSSLEREVLPQEVSPIEIISGTLNQMKQCPIRIIINDPSETVKIVYCVIANQIYRIETINNPKFGGTCVVQFASTEDEPADICTFDIEDLKMAFDENSQMKPEVGSYNFLMFPTMSAARTHIDDILKELDKQTIGLAAREKDLMKKQHDEDLRLLKNEINRKDQIIKEQETEIKGLRKMFELNCDREKREAQTNTLQVQEQLQQYAVQKEQARVAKSVNDLKSSEVSTSAVVAKSAAVVAPLVAGAIGVYMSRSTSEIIRYGAMATVALGVTKALSSTWGWIKDTLL